MADIATEHTTFFTGYITAWIRRHRRLVLLGWLVIAILLIGTCFSIGANEDVVFTLPGESGEAIDLLRDRFDFGEEGSSSEIIVFSHPTLTVDDSEYKSTVQDLLGDLRDIRGVVTTTDGETEVVSSYRVFSDTLSHYDIGAPRESSPLVSQNSEGGDVTFASAEYASELDDAGLDDLTDTVDTIIELVSNQAWGGWPRQALAAKTGRRAYPR